MSSNESQKLLTVRDLDSWLPAGARLQQQIQCLKATHYSQLSLSSKQNHVVSTQKSPMCCLWSFNMTPDWDCWCLRFGFLLFFPLSHFLHHFQCVYFTGEIDHLEMNQTFRDWPGRQHKISRNFGNKVRVTQATQCAKLVITSNGGSIVWYLLGLMMKNHCDTPHSRAFLS